MEKEIKRQFTIPVTTRSLVVLEVASELVSRKRKDWPYPQAKVSLRNQGDEDWKVCFFGSDTPGAIDAVAGGDVQVAIMNPAEPLNLAVRGTGPFKEPIPLRIITVIPSFDQLAFAVTEKTGLTSLAQIRERRFPLKVSLRGQKDHSLHFMVRHVLSAYDFTLEDIVSWGGEVRYDPGLPDEGSGRLAAVRRGEIDAIFDEAINIWLNLGLDLGMRFLELEEPYLQKLEKMGYHRAPITKEEFPRIGQDIMSIDFSGWPIFTHANVSDDIIASFCSALEARKDRIPWQGEGPLPLERMCKDSPDTPLDIPLHPAAEGFWRECGYLPGE